MSERRCNLLSLTAGWEENPSPSHTGDARLVRLETLSVALAGYHAQIGTETAKTSTEWISGPRLDRRGAQTSVAPTPTGSC
jgi:hypothetical protein